MNCPQIERVLPRLAQVKANGDRSWMACCPSHDDRHPSLSIRLADDGRVLLKCFAGCSGDEVRTALGLEWRDLSPEGHHQKPPPATTTGFERRPQGDGFQAADSVSPRVFATLHEARDAYCRMLGDPVAEWTYCDAQGEMIGQVLRWQTPNGKSIRPVFRIAEGWSLTYPATRPLFGLERLSGEDRVFVVEGEKAAECLHRLGFASTTSPGGAFAASRADWTALNAREVLILPDADGPGEDFARVVTEILKAPGRVIATLHLPGLRRNSGDDIVEWISMKRAESDEDPAALLTSLAESALVRERRQSPILTAGEILRDPAWREPPKILRSGVGWFDRIQPFGGLEPGTLTVIAAPPRCFKTALLLYLAWQFAAQGLRVHYLAGEMTRRALLRRLVAMAGPVSTAAVTSAATLRDHQAVDDAAAGLSDLGDRLAFGRAPITISAIRESAESADLIIVDYLQLILPSRTDAQAGRAEQLEASMGELLSLGQQGATIMAAAALNRAKRDESSLGSIRGSSAIEYGATTIYATSESLCGLDGSATRPWEPYQSVEYRCLKQREGAAIPLEFDLALEFGPLPMESRG